VIEDPAVLGEPGTDTHRLLEAGARRVLWAIARHGAVQEAWRAVRNRLAAEERVVMEGSTIVGQAKPDRLVFVVHPFLSPSRWKPTSAALLSEADIVVVNRPAAEVREPSAEVLEAVAGARGHGRTRVADVTRPLPEWAPDLAGDLASPSPIPADGLAHAHADITRP